MTSSIMVLEGLANLTAQTKLGVSKNETTSH